jgi:hypothetical protein
MLRCKAPKRPGHVQPGYGHTCTKAEDLRLLKDPQGVRAQDERKGPAREYDRTGRTSLKAGELASAEMRVDHDQLPRRLHESFRTALAFVKSTRVLMFDTQARLGNLFLHFKPIAVESD